jgi:hypothetical protein
VLSAITTLAIGALAFARVMGLSRAGPIPYALALSAAIQLALLAPLFITIVRRRALAASPRTVRVGSLLPGTVIVVLRRPRRVPVLRRELEVSISRPEQRHYSTVGLDEKRAAIAGGPPAGTGRVFRRHEGRRIGV